PPRSWPRIRDRPRRRSATASPATSAGAPGTRRCWPRSPRPPARCRPSEDDDMSMKTTREVRGVGLAIPRPDGPEKVTGKVEYVADLKPRGLLHAKLLRRPHAHARIVRIDATRARALPGVRAVLTAADVPELKRQAPTRAHAVLAIDRAVFAGQPVAAVAADEPAIAEEALDLIEGEDEVLPAAVDPPPAMPPRAPPGPRAGTGAGPRRAPGP